MASLLGERFLPEPTGFASGPQPRGLTPRRGKSTAGDDQRAPKSRSICRALLLKPKSSTCSSVDRTRPDQSNADPSRIARRGGRGCYSRAMPPTAGASKATARIQRPGRAVLSLVRLVRWRDMALLRRRGDLWGGSSPEPGGRVPANSPRKSPEKPWQFVAFLPPARQTTMPLPAYNLGLPASGQSQEAALTDAE